MTNKYPFTILFLLIVLIGCFTPKKDRGGQDQLSGKMEIHQGWARPVAKGLNSAAYLTIYNGTGQNDTLVAIRSKHINKAEIHESYTTEGGLSGMRPTGKLAIASGDSLTLEPGGMHIMLMSTTKIFTEDDSLNIELEFANTGAKALAVPVRQQEF